MKENERPQVLRLAHSRAAQDDTSFGWMEKNRQRREQQQKRNAGILRYAQNDRLLAEAGR
jgi:hypothetical protein